MGGQHNPVMQDWTILKLLSWTTDYFKKNSIDSPRAAAEILLAHALSVKRIDLYLRYDQPLTEDELSAFKKLIQRRLEREPVAYITGEKEFWSKGFSVSEHVLIPRPETECLVEETISLIRKDSGPDAGRMSVFEPGTGSGAVIITIASECPGHRFIASDVSDKALDQARYNSRRYGLENSINFCSGSWFAPVQDSKEAFDIIVSNPPYIPAGDISGLQPEICKYEPEIALNGGDSGFDSVGYIVRNACIYLKPQGYLLLEIGYDQEEGVREIIDSSGSYEKPVFRQDYSGHCRVVKVRKK